jgi:hypothetical protein
MTFPAAQQRNAGKRRIRGFSKETPECSGFSSGLDAQGQRKNRKNGPIRLNSLAMPGPAKGSGHPAGPIGHAGIQFHQ